MKDGCRKPDGGKARTWTQNASRMPFGDRAVEARRSTPEGSDRARDAAARSERRRQATTHARATRARLGWVGKTPWGTLVCALLAKNGLYFFCKKISPLFCG